MNRMPPIDLEAKRDLIVAKPVFTADKIACHSEKKPGRIVNPNDFETIGIRLHVHASGQRQEA